MILVDLLLMLILASGLTLFTVFALAGKDLLQVTLIILLTVLVAHLMEITILTMFMAILW